MYSQSTVIAGGLAHIPVVIGVFSFIQKSFSKRVTRSIYLIIRKDLVYFLEFFISKQKFYFYHHRSFQILTR